MNHFHGVAAGLLTAPAFFGADPAMLVMPCMLLAFLGADATCERTGFDHRTEHVLIGPRAARGERSGCTAHVGAIQVESNALPQLRHVVFREAGIRA